MKAPGCFGIAVAVALGIVLYFVLYYFFMGMVILFAIYYLLKPALFLGACIGLGLFLRWMLQQAWPSKS